MFPNEIYMKILKYIPYENLYGNIRLVNHQFSQIASEIIEKYDLGWILIFIDYHRPLLQCDPPAFIKVERIYFYCDQITAELVTFLQRMKKVISSCRVDIDELDFFISVLERSNISLDVFFDALPTPCYRFWIDQAYCFSSNKFFSSSYVLRCINLNIQEFDDGSDYESLINFLFAEPKITRSINLVEYSNDCVYKLFDNIKKRAIEKFEVENKLKIHYFNESTFVFYSSKSDWEERKEEILAENNNGNDIDQSRFTKIFIEMEEESENKDEEEEEFKSEEEDIVNDEDYFSTDENEDEEG
uniref:F-box domain-containing protein n=1 Tax=Meloidogyne hapla TaxID=6305 RepID=A0A1I8B862_MELHA